MLTRRLERSFIIVIFFIKSGQAFSQSLVNSTGNTIQSSTISIEYSIGEIGITTLESNENNITQGLLQPIYRLKDCNLLHLIPNAFTPNRDNVNDCFGVKNWPIPSSYQLNVYNRWGMLVFKTNNIAECWNGEVNGIKQDMGAYVYMIKANTPACGQITYKGTVLLIR